MSRFENPVPDLKEATDAFTRIFSLQADLFLLNQELRTLRQVKRTLWLGGSLLFFNLLLAFTFYWIAVGLHEDGWTATSLAGLSILFFGTLVFFSAFIAIRMGKTRKTKEAV